VHSKFVNAFKRIRDAEKTFRITEVFGYVVALFDGSETKKIQLRRVTHKFEFGFEICMQQNYHSSGDGEIS